MSKIRKNSLLSPENSKISLETVGGEISPPEVRGAAAAATRAAIALPGAELSYREWLTRYCPGATDRPFGEHHTRVWEWFEALKPGVKPDALIECWPRGHGKSTSCETALARQAVKATRRFALYVSCNQAAANRHVQAIGAIMERAGVQRAVNAYGFSRGWKADLLRTSNGFNALAFGLDAGARGVKLDEIRPDVIVLDDVDQLGDSLATVARKLEVITQTVLPAGSSDAAVVFVQNKIHQHSVMTGVVEGTLDLLRRRKEAPVIVAVEGLAYEKTAPDAEGRQLYRITGGRPTWEGKPLSVCEAEMNDFGLVAFLRECQQDVTVGGRFFADWDEARHVVFEDEANVERTWTYIGGYDWGFGKPCCFLLAAVDSRGRVVFIDEEYHTQLTDAEQAQKVVECCTRWKLPPARVTVYADPSMWAQKTDHSGKKVANVDAFHKAGLRFVPASNNRRHGWSNFRRYLRDSDREPDQAPVPLLRVLKGRCPNLIRTIPQQVFDPTDVEDLDTDGEDHAVDSARYCLASRMRAAGTSATPEGAVPEEAPAWYKRAVAQKNRKTARKL